MDAVEVVNDRVTDLVKRVEGIEAQLVEVRAMFDEVRTLLAELLTEAEEPAAPAWKGGSTVTDFAANPAVKDRL